MTDRFVGPGGNDGATGLSWANRKLTLNGVEDSPVVAGDTVYVGPGVYREQLTCDMNGSAGNRITYVGDILGFNTDGIGGIVRITGINADDSHPPSRTICISIVDRSYRTFKNLYIGEAKGGGTLNGNIDWGGSSVSNITIDGCVFAGSAFDGGTGGCYFTSYQLSGTLSGLIFKNCYFDFAGNRPIRIELLSEANVTDSFIDNCIFTATRTGTGGIQAISIYRGGDISVRASSFIGSAYGIGSGNLTVLTDYAYDNLFEYSEQGMGSDTETFVDDDYNLYNNAGNTYSEGVNDLTTNRPSWTPTLVAGYKIPWNIHEPRAYNASILQSSTSGLTKDIYGLTRPSSGKFTRGAVQFKGVDRDASEYLTAPSSMRMNDASICINTLPINAGRKITVSIWVKREANYAGTNPQLVLSIPDGTQVVSTDVGASAQYNNLVASITPGVGNKWLQVEFRSNNTATSGNYRVWFDKFELIRTPKSVFPTMKWITNEILLVAFPLDEVYDPWIIPGIPIPQGAPTYSDVGPMPTFRRA